MSTPATTSTSGNFLNVRKWRSEMPPQPTMATRSFLPEKSDLDSGAKDCWETPVAMSRTSVKWAQERGCAALCGGGEPGSNPAQPQQRERVPPWENAMADEVVPRCDERR